MLLITKVIQFAWHTNVRQYFNYYTTHTNSKYINIFCTGIHGNFLLGGETDRPQRHRQINQLTVIAFYTS